MAAKTSRSRGAAKDDDFYTRIRDRVAGWAKKSTINAKYRDYILALPDLFHLVVRLTMDKRVDATSKVVLGAAVAWAVAPFDLLPDALGPVGYLDDLLVLALALDFMLDRTPRAVVLEHWAGSGDVFVLIRTILDRADEWMGRGLYQKIRSFVERTLKPEMGSRAAARPKAARRKTAARRTARASAATAPKRGKTATPKAAAPRRKAARKKAAKRSPRSAS